MSNASSKDLPPIHVTEPFLPPLAEVVRLLEGVWQRNLWTNQGPLVRELEQRLAEFLGMAPIHLVTNGALGLHLAFQALGIQGEIVTTPFSYVATTSCPLWDKLPIVFADIEPDTLTISPPAIEAAITPRSEAILATHVYGNPCDVEAIEKIAQRHGLAVIYDAAHAFGVRYRGRSILEWGDLSMVSLHATKLFHTAEGGLMAGSNAAALAKLEWMRRFGHNGPEAFHGVGTNAKMTEIHAAIGLSVLPLIAQILAARQAIFARYDQAFDDEQWPIQRPVVRAETQHNFAYYPIVLPSESVLLRLKQTLEEAKIFTRRYFYPSLAGLFGGTDESTPVCADVSRRVLCLPLSAQMTSTAIERVIAGVRRGLSQ